LSASYAFLIFDCLVKLEVSLAALLPLTAELTYTGKLNVEVTLDRRMYGFVFWANNFTLLSGQNLV